MPYPKDRKGLSLPDHIEMSEDGAVCMHCGGQVDDRGYASGGEVVAPEPKKEPQPESKASRLYAAALKLKESK